MKVLIVSALLVASLSAFADQKIEALEACKGREDVAKSFMNARQIGMPKSRVYGNIDKRANDKQVGDFFKKIVDVAYAEPIYQGKAEKAAAIERFGSNMFMVCMSDYWPEK